jgi:Family of unknown function (DUF5335)
MRTVEIPWKDWSRALDSFSAMHEGWIVTLELMNPALGVQPEICDLPLLGVTAETDTPSPAITIAAARSSAEHVTHTIHAPTHVRIERTDDDADVALQVESEDGTAAILRFKTVARPDTVDGVPRPLPH